MKFRDKPLEDWEEVVIRLHQEQKLGFREIGRQLGVSRSRAAQIYHAAQDRLKDFAVHGDAALSRLPERVRRLVVELGLDRPALARAAIESGRLVWLEGNAAILWNGKMVPHSAGRTWELLNAWAGLPYRPRRRWR